MNILYMNSSGCYIDSQGLRTAGKYLFPGFCRPGIFRFAGIFRVLWISHRNIEGRMAGRFPACGSFAYRTDDNWTRGGTYAHGFENGRGRPHAPPLRQICRNALVAVACGYSLVCHRRCCCSIMANEKSQPIINQLRFYFRVPRTIFESCTFEPFVNTLIFNYL